MRAGTTQTDAGTGALGHVFLGGLGDGGQGVAVDVEGAGFGGAFAGGTAGTVAAVALWVGGVGEGGLQGVEVGELGDGVAVELDEAVFGPFLDVLVDEATGVYARHVWGVQRSHFLELTLVGVASVLGQTCGC